MTFVAGLMGSFAGTLVGMMLVGWLVFGGRE
jgi:hypothetical protein